MLATAAALAVTGAGVLQQQPRCRFTLDFLDGAAAARLDGGASALACRCINARKSALASSPFFRSTKQAAGVATVALVEDFQF